MNPIRSRSVIDHPPLLPGVMDWKDIGIGNRVRIVNKGGRLVVDQDFGGKISTVPLEVFEEKFPLLTWILAKNDTAA